MSTATKLYNHVELAELLRESQAKNAVSGITGMLLYSEGSFVQVLEGERDPVELTYLKIVMDPRHRHVIKLVDGHLENRIFPNWSMGFRTLSKQQFQEFDAYVTNAERNILNGDESHPAISILKSFAENNQL